LNGLLGRADQIDFFHRLHFDCAVGGLIRSGSQTPAGARRPHCHLRGIVSEVLTIFNFTNHTLTAKPNAFPLWVRTLSGDSAGRVVNNALVRMVLAIFISPIALYLGIKSLLATDAGSCQPLPVVRGSSVANYFSPITI